MTLETMGLTTDAPFHTPSPETVATSQLTQFMHFCESETGHSFVDYPSFERFSITDFRAFWRLFLEWAPLLHEGSSEPVCTSDDVETAQFFPHLRLNYVESLLREVAEAEDADAVVSHHANGDTVRLTRRQLRRDVMMVAQALEDRGVMAGDRVVAVSSNTEELIVASLAVMALGATLSTAAPDMGAAAVLTRFGQLAPTLLIFGVEGTSLFDPDERKHRLDELISGLPSLQAVCILDDRACSQELDVSVFTLSELRDDKAGTPPTALTWRRFPFSHPLCILFSSGTTGVPKCIVHTAGGVLLEHAKEHVLHGDLRSDDVMFFQTSPAWMMWNWQLSALVTGATIILYSGMVSDPDALWCVVEADEVTVFGTSPAYLQLSESADLCPNQQHDLTNLRVLVSTGSILYGRQFDWVRDKVAPIPVQSISGGTDIVGCFVLGNPNLPVYRGELQCRSLGLDVRALGQTASQVGELTCWNPFPSRPSGFFGDVTGEGFHRAYFSEHPRVWTHGDRIEFNPRGSARLHGRSDGVMNIRGVRIGPSEIYMLLKDVPRLQQVMAVEQDPPDDAGPSRLLLLVVLEGGTELTHSLELSIRQTILHGASAVHVPSLIVAVPDLPRTFSGKDSERSARDAVNGLEVSNRQALRNPESVDRIREAVLRAQSRRTFQSDTGENTDEVGAIRAIFSSLINAPVVDRKDSFFDLGGTSMLIPQLCRDIHDRLGYELPLSAVFSDPTPLGLWGVLHKDSAGTSDFLVEMRRGDATERPIFFIYDISGDVLPYAQLVSRLPGNRPIYGIRARGLDGRVPMDQSVADMAEAAIDSIRLVQLAGPYTLCGYSFGGLVAYEIARRIEVSGGEMDLVILLDTYLDPHCLPRPRRVLFYMVTRQLQWLRWAAEADLVTRGEAIRRFLSRRLPWASANDASTVRTPLQNRFLEVASKSMRHFVPLRYLGNVVFVQPKDRFASACNPVPIWRGATGAGKLSVVPVSGGHLDLMDVSRVDELAAALTPFLKLNRPDGRVGDH